MSLFGNRNFKEAVNFKIRSLVFTLIQYDWGPLKEEKIRSEMHTEKRPYDDTVKRWPCRSQEDWLEKKLILPTT